MTERLELTYNWHISRALNTLLCGNPSEPLCSRAWRRQWGFFIDCMAVLFKDPAHCEAVHIRWLELRLR